MLDFCIVTCLNYVNVILFQNEIFCILYLLFFSHYLATMLNNKTYKLHSANTIFIFYLQTYNSKKAPQPNYIVNIHLNKFPEICHWHYHFLHIFLFIVYLCSNNTIFIEGNTVLSKCCRTSKKFSTFMIHSFYKNIKQLIYELIMNLF